MFNKKKIVIVVFLFLFLVLASCGKKEIIFKLEENDIELNVGDKYTPKIVVENIEKYNLDEEKYVYRSQ